MRNLVPVRQTKGEEPTMKAQVTLDAAELNRLLASVAFYRAGCKDRSAITKQELEALYTKLSLAESMTRTAAAVQKTMQETA